MRILGIGRVAETFGGVVREGSEIESVQTWTNITLSEFAQDLLDMHFGIGDLPAPRRYARVAMDQADFGTQTTEPLQYSGLPVWSTAVRTRPQFQKDLERNLAQWNKQGRYGAWPIDNAEVWTPAALIALRMTFVMPDNDELNSGTQRLERESFWGT